MLTSAPRTSNVPRGVKAQGTLAFVWQSLDLSPISGGSSQGPLQQIWLATQVLGFSRFFQRFLLLCRPLRPRLVRIPALKCVELLLRLLELECHLGHLLGALDFGIIPFVRLQRVLGLEILVLAFPFEKLFALFFNLLAKILDLLLHTSLHLFEGGRLVSLLVLNLDRELFLLPLRFLERTFQVL